MGAKKIWAESGSTPDWLDVEMALRAVDGVHSGTTMVTISPVGTGSVGGFRVVISTHWEAIPGSVGLSEVVTERAWIGHRNNELPAFVLGGIYAHDFAVGNAYKQKTLDP
jgi:hypothetical protein